MQCLETRMRADEGHTFLDIHTRSIRGLASSHYTADVVDGWVVPATEESVRNFLKNPDDEIRLIAELMGNQWVYTPPNVLVWPQATARQWSLGSKRAIP